jgi:hypothetical protein
MIKLLISDRFDALALHAVEFLGISEEESYEILTIRLEEADTGDINFLASSHIEAGYDQGRVYDLTVAEFMSRQELELARAACNGNEGCAQLDLIEDAHIQECIRTGNYVVLEEPDGTRRRIFPMNDSVQINVD